MFVIHARTPRGIVSDSGRPNLKQGFSALVEDGTRSGLCKDFTLDPPTCELTDEGQTLFGNISMAYRNSREAPGDKKGKRLNDAALLGEFKRWLTSEILASDTEASEANVRDGDSESRLVVVLLQPAQSGEIKFTAGCTLVMTSGQKNKQPMIEVLRTLLQNDENLLRSCHFSRIQ